MSADHGSGTSRPSVRTRRVVLITREYQPRVTAGDAPDTPRGGIARAMSMHAHALSAAGVEDVHVITLSPDDLQHSFSDGAVQVHRIPEPSVVTPPEMQYAKLGVWSHCVAAKYGELDAQVGFDVVEAPDWYGELLHLRPRPGTALVVSLHSLSGVIGPENGRLPTPGAHAWDALELLALQRADHLIAPTQLIFDDTHTLLGQRTPRASLIPLPFDAERFPMRSHDVRPDRPMTLTFAGRIERRKGPDLALRVAAAAAERGLPVRMEVLGRPDPGYWESTVNPLLSRLQLPEIEWAGELSEQEVSRRLRASDCAVLPSRWENFHMAAVEALSSGLPVITTDRSGLAGWFNREQGLLALPIDDEDAYVATAVDALSDRDWLQTAGHVGAERVRRLLDPHAVARQVLSVYDGLVRMRAGEPVLDATDMPPSPKIPERGVSSALHREALSAFAQGRVTDARTLAVRALEAEGGVTRLNDLAVMLAQAGEAEQARVLLRACLIVRPGDRDAATNLGLIDQLRPASAEAA